MKNVKIGDKVEVFKNLQFQLPIFKKCEVTEYPVDKKDLAKNEDPKDFIKIKTSKNIVRIVLLSQCSPYVESEITDDQSTD